MNIFKASFYTGISTCVRILAGLIVIKAIAIFVGPEGLGKMGQFMSLLTCLTVLAGGGVANGVIKYIAEFNGKISEIKSTIGNAMFFTLSCSLVTAVLCLVFKSELSLWLLGDEKFESLIVILAFAQFLIGLNNLLVAIVNGFKDIKKLTKLNIVGSLVGVFAMFLLIRAYHLYGGLLGLIVMQSVLFFVTSYYVLRSDWFQWDFLKLNFNSTKFFNLFKFSLMSVTTAIVTPIAQIIIRNHVQHVLSWADVGYWQAVSRISDVYLLFITTTLTAYYLPKMSAITDLIDLKFELYKTYKVVIPFVILLALLVYAMKYWIILLLFTPAFMAMKNLFAFQLVGDVIKIAAWLISYLMLAKAMTKTFIATEIIFSVTLVVGSFIFLHFFGLVGLTYAFAFNYLIYFVVMLCISRTMFKII